MELKEDSQLISQYLAGDEKSLEILVAKYLQVIYSFTFQFVHNSDEAQDLTQEVFVKAWKNLKKFDQTKSFKTWLLSIAKNTSLDFLKKKKSLPFSSFNHENGENFILDTIEDQGLLPSEQYEQTNAMDRLKESVNRLSNNYSKILHLHYFEQATFNEIAQKTGESINTVKSRYRRALLALRKILAERL